MSKIGALRSVGAEHALVQNKESATGGISVEEGVPQCTGSGTQASELGYASIGTVNGEPVVRAKKIEGLRFDTMRFKGDYPDVYEAYRKPYAGRERDAQRQLLTELRQPTNRAQVDEAYAEYFAVLDQADRERDPHPLPDIAC
ncbi:MAG: hypothetical protein V7646_4253 [Pseudonocardia sp.]